MAALTWREVSAPVLDTRGLAQAGAGITGAFDKLGDMFIKREENLRAKSTDAAIAQALASQDPEAVKALLAGGTGQLGERVDARAYMEALGQHRNRLIDTDMKDNQRLDALSLTNNADLLDRLGKARLAGDQEAIAGVMAEFSTRADGKRALGQNWSKFIDIDDTGIDNRLDRDEFGEQRRSNLAGEADARARTGIAGAELALRRQESAQQSILRELQIAEARTNHDNNTATARMAPRINAYVDSFQKNGISSDAALVALKKTSEWKTLSASEQKALETGVGTVLGEKRALTQDARTLNGLDKFDSIVGGEVQKIQAERETAIREFKDKNPGYYIASRMTSLGDKEPTQNEILELYKQKVPWALRDRAFEAGVVDGTINPRAAKVALTDFSGEGMFNDDDRYLEAARLGTEEYKKYGPERGNLAIAKFADPLDRSIAEFERKKALAAQDVGDGRNAVAIRRQLVEQIRAEEARRKAKKGIPRP